MSDENDYITNDGSVNVFSLDIIKKTKPLGLYMQSIGRARRPFTGEQIKDFSEFCLHNEAYCKRVLELVSVHSIMTNYQVIEMLKNTIINSPSTIERINDMCIFALSLDENYKFSVKFFDTIKNLFCRGCTAENLLYQLKCFMKNKIK